MQMYNNDVPIVSPDMIMISHATVLYIVWLYQRSNNNCMVQDTWSYSRALFVAACLSVSVSELCAWSPVPQGWVRAWLGRELVGTYPHPCSYHNICTKSPHILHTDTLWLLSAIKQKCSAQVM